jgi:hypothetical protein
MPSNLESNVDIFAPPPEGLLSSSHRRTNEMSSTVVKKRNSSHITVITTGGQDKKWNNVVDSANINFQSITEKWNLPLTAIPVLKEIQQKRTEYNSTSDILALIHPLKTGGTSFSLMLRDIFGKKRIFPGSGASAHFVHPVFQKELEMNPPNESPEYWYNKAIIYTHSILRPHAMRSKKKKEKSPKRYLLHYLREQVGAPLKEKKIRLMAMIRNPLDLAASRFYETECRVMAYTKGMKEATIPSECPQVNLTDVARIRTEIATTQCRKGKKIFEGCNKIDFSHCESIDKFLESKRRHNQYSRIIMGKLEGIKINDVSILIDFLKLLFSLFFTFATLPNLGFSTH